MPKHIKAPTGKALIYSNISLKLLRSCFVPAGASTGLCNKNNKLNQSCEQKVPFHQVQNDILYDWKSLSPKCMTLHQKNDKSSYTA